MTGDHHSHTVTPPAASGRPAAGRRYVPLFWRLFLPNAAVLGAATSVLVLAPPNGRIPTILAGFVVLLAVNVLLMRHAFAPLTRLAELARRVDPLRPGQRLPLQGPDSEVRVLTESINEMLSRLETERRDSARRALAAEQEQRRAVARELHDELGQELTAIRLQVAQLEGRLEGAARTQAVQLREQLDEALASLRRIARLLRPEALDDLGLTAALVALCERTSERTGLVVEASVSRELPALSVEGELVLFRVAQESLTNVVRHAGARRARLQLREDAGCVVLSVADDGHGIANGGFREGQGIRGMRERALLVDGELSLQPVTTGGTEVRLALPAGAA